MIVYLLFLFSLKANAFPDMIRHGYTGCLNCHSSVVGGDLLSAYGRVVKNELVTSNFWSQEEKEQKAWKMQTPEWFQAGFNIRTLQYFRENTQKSQGRFIIMQADFDMIATFMEKWKIYLSGGRYDTSKKDADWRDFFYTPRAWAGYEDTFLGVERGLQFRLGRFSPAYGVYMVEHSYGPRQNLGFNSGQERIAAELSLSREQDQLVLTALTERASYSNYISEKGFILQYSRNFGSNYRVGLNIYRSKLGVEMQNKKVKMDGLFAILGFDEKWSSIIQFDRFYDAQNNEGRNFFMKVDKEVELGWHLFGVLEYYNPWVERTNPNRNSMGLGTQYFWNSNFDVQAFYKKEKNTAELNEYQDIFWFVFHLGI